MVTALGIRKEERKLGYAATTVKVDEITQNRTTNVMKSLEGKVAGLEIAPPTAGAGASTRIRLRGQSGFAGQTNSPLIVIDGLPMDQDARSAEGAPGIDQGDNLQQINPDDIESMTVLKGSTARRFMVPELQMAPLSSSPKAALKIRNSGWNLPRTLPLMK